MGAREYYQALGKIEKKGKRFETLGDLAQLGLAAGVGGIKNIWGNVQSWKDLKTGLGIAKETGIEIDEEGLFPGKNLLKKLFTSPGGLFQEDTVKGAEVDTGAVKDYALKSLEKYGAGVRGEWDIFDPKWDRFRRSLFEAKDGISPVLKSGDDVDENQADSGSVQSQITNLANSVKPNVPVFEGTFPEAFGEAHKKFGTGSQFEWEGNIYTTDLKEEL